MKKIFAILLSLAMVVSLGVMAVAPVAAATQQPSISPTAATYDLDNPAEIAVDITWGSASTVTQIYETGSGALAGGDYDLYTADGLLVIKSSYLSGQLTFVGDTITLVIVFDVGQCVLSVTATGNNPTVSPSSATWVKGSSTGVSTTIIWGAATSLTSVTELIGGAAATYTQSSAPSGDYVVIDPTYLNGKLADIGDSIVLVFTFDVGACTFTITAVGPDPTISPASANWILGSSSIVSTTITWNAATTLTSITEAGVGVVAPANYVLYDNLLVITNGWLIGNANLAAAGDTVTLVLDFDVGECVFTITATGANLPSISPASATYCVGACPADNVTFTITYAGGATGITSVVDVTAPTVTVPLVSGAGNDYVVSGNDLTIFGGPTGTWLTGWGGFECNLDCYLRGARIIEVTFNDTCNTKVLLTVTTDCCSAPSLSSTALTYDLDKALSTSCLYDSAYAYVAALVTWGTATNIASITDDTGCTNSTLSGGSVYAANDYYCAYYAPYATDVLFFYKATYLGIACMPGVNFPPSSGLIGQIGAGANLQDCGDDVTLTIYWAPANPTCAVAQYPNKYYPYRYAPTKVTITAVGTPASVSPSTAQFNIDSPSNVTGMISWGPHATNITRITCGNCEAPPLVYGTDYTFDPYVDCDTDSCLYIMEEWLTNEDELRSGCLLEEVDDTIVLNIEFDKCDDATFTIRAVGTPLCFIATAAGADAPQLDILREFRDVVMRPNRLGAELVSLYYQTSPPIAEFISQNEALKAVVKVGLIDPIAAILNGSHGLWS